MFQGMVSWAFFHVSRGSVSALEAGQREDTHSEEQIPVPAALSLWGRLESSRKPQPVPSV